MGLIDLRAFQLLICPLLVLIALHQHSLKLHPLIFLIDFSANEGVPVEEGEFRELEFLLQFKELLVGVGNTRKFGDVEKEWESVFHVGLLIGQEGIIYTKKAAV